MVWCAGGWSFLNHVPRSGVECAVTAELDDKSLYRCTSKLIDCMVSQLLFSVIVRYYNCRLCCCFFNHLFAFGNYSMCIKIYLIV